MILEVPEIWFAWYQDTTQQDAFNDPSAEGQGHRSRSNVQKLAKINKIGHISDAISPTDFILGTKVQPNKVHSMTQVPKVKFEFSQKWVKNQRTGHISEAILPTDFILGTKVQPTKAHSMT